MSGREPSWSDRIRELIEQVDRARYESERLRGQVDDSMKKPLIWPDRRRVPRFPEDDNSYRHHRHGP